MEIGIVGGREFNNTEKFHNHICGFIAGNQSNNGYTIISGGATGADELAKDFAKEAGMDFVPFQPAHELDQGVPYNRKWYFIRNRQIVDNSDVVVAFWDGRSRGTKYTLEYAKKQGKKITVFSI